MFSESREVLCLMFFDQDCWRLRVLGGERDGDWLRREDAGLALREEAEKVVDLAKGVDGVETTCGLASGL